MIKGFDRIERFTPKDLKEYGQEIKESWVGAAANIGKRVIEDITYRAHGIFMIDDMTGELAAVCSYSDEPIFTDSPKHAGIFEQVNTNGKSAFPAIEILNIAGQGKGAAGALLKGLIAAAESEGKILHLEAVHNKDNNSTGFYRHMGMTEAGDAGFNQNVYFTYIPKALRRKN